MAVQLPPQQSFLDDFFNGLLSRYQLVNAVHGALALHDPSDLARALSGKLTIEKPADATGNVIEAPKQ